MDAPDIIYVPARDDKAIEPWQNIFSDDNGNVAYMRVGMLTEWLQKKIAACDVILVRTPYQMKHAERMAYQSVLDEINSHLK